VGEVEDIHPIFVALRLPPEAPTVDQSLLLPHKKWLTGEADKEIKPALRLSHQFLFRCWGLYLVMAFLFGPKMWKRFAGSEAKKGCQVPACLRVVNRGQTPPPRPRPKPSAKTMLK
jgi:hypothetical protein